MTEQGFHWFPEHDDRPAAFAECTGWMALGRPKRTVSVIVPARDQLTRLVALVPVLADVLTDAGLPWEILVMDQGSSDGTFAVARRWSQLPGYRLARCMNGCSRAAAIAAGLMRARGDVVLVMDPALRRGPSLVREALEQWDDGARLVVGSDTLAPHALMHEDPDSLPMPLPGSQRYLADFDISRDGLVLFDRQIVSELLG